MDSQGMEEYWKRVRVMLMADRLLKVCKAFVVNHDLESQMLRGRQKWEFQRDPTVRAARSLIAYVEGTPDTDHRPAPPRPSTLSLPEADIDIRAKSARKALAKAGVDTVGDLIKWTAEELLALTGLGSDTLRVIECKLDGYELALATPPDE